MTRKFNLMILFVLAGTIAAFCFYGALMGYSRIKRAHLVVTSQGSEGIFRTAAATIREAVRGGPTFDLSELNEAEIERIKEIEAGNVDPRLLTDLRREGIDVELLQLVRHSARLMLLHPDPAVRREARNLAMAKIRGAAGEEAELLKEIERLERNAGEGRFSKPDEGILRNFIASVKRSYAVIFKETGED